MPRIREGGEAPDFDVTDSRGLRLRLSQLCESGPVVIAFYPRAFTPG